MTSGKKPNCDLCDINKEPENLKSYLIWDSEEWLLRHDSAPCPIAGWLTLQPKRHVQGISGLTEKEAIRFGILSRSISIGIEQALGVSKVYSVAFGESVPHMHVHFIPRYSDLDTDYLGFGIADLQRNVKRKLEAECDSEEVIKAISLLKNIFVGSDL